MILFQHIFQRNLLHPFFRCILDVKVKITQCQLNVHAHATSGVGVDVLMEQWLVALYCPIGIQQSDFLRLTSQSGSRTRWGSGRT